MGNLEKRSRQGGTGPAHEAGEKREEKQTGASGADTVYETR